MKLYIDTSFINHCVNLNYKPEDARHGLRGMGYEPTIGTHVIYELARTFLASGAEARATALFTFLRDVNPFYGLTVPQLFNSEILKLRTGAFVIPVQDPINYASMRIEISRLASGIFDVRSRAFILRRQREFERDRKKIYLITLKMLKE